MLKVNLCFLGCVTTGYILCNAKFEATTAQVPYTTVTRPSLYAKGWAAPDYTKPLWSRVRDYSWDTMKLREYFHQTITTS